MCAPFSEVGPGTDHTVLQVDSHIWGHMQRAQLVLEWPNELTVKSEGL